MANEFGSTIQGGDFKPQLASMYDQPGMTTDEIRRRMIQQRKLPLEALKKGESVQFQGVSGPAEQPFESDEADIANFMIEFEKKRRKEREGRSPQSVTSDQLASVLDVPGVPESMSPMIGSELESFGVLQSDMAPDLGPLEPKAIIEGAAKVPLRPGVSPDVMEEISAPVPQRFGPKTRPIPAKEPAQMPSETPVETNIYGGGEMGASDIIPESEIVGPPVPPMDMRTDFEVDEDIAKQIAAAFEDPDEKDRMEQRATAGSMDDLVSLAVLGLGPAVVGQLFGGEYGGIIGADLGMKNLETRQKQQFELEKQQRELASKKATGTRDLAEKMALAGYKEALGRKTAEVGDIRKSVLKRDEKRFDQGFDRMMQDIRLSHAEKMENIREGARIKTMNIDSIGKLNQELRKNKTRDLFKVNADLVNALSKRIKQVGGINKYITGEGLNKGVSDFDLVFGYIKGIDNSVVREGEFYTLEESADGSLNRIIRAWNRNVDPETGRLPPGARLEILQLIQNRANVTRDAYEAYRNELVQDAKRRGLDTSMVVSAPIRMDMYTLPESLPGTKTKGRVETAGEKARMRLEGSYRK